MKFSLVAVAFASAVSASQQSQQMDSSMALDIGSLVQQAGPLIKKGKCALPCLYQAANSLKCEDAGLVDTACNNIDTIQQQSAPCVAKCNIDSNTRGLVLKVATSLCNKRGQA